jgi:hypothetical protein
MNSKSTDPDFGGYKKELFSSLLFSSLLFFDTILFYILEKYFKKFFVLPTLPSNEKNSSNYHNSYNKGPNLVFFSFTESPSISLPT